MITLMAQHPYISLCAIIWFVCGIISGIIKDTEPLWIALGAIVVVGIGYAIKTGLIH